jgi:hypothetical protein
MKSFKKLRDFARQGSRSKEKHHHNPPQHHHPQQQQEGGDDSSYALPSEDAQVAKGMKVRSLFLEAPAKGDVSVVF